MSGSCVIVVYRERGQPAAGLLYEHRGLHTGSPDRRISHERLYKVNGHRRQALSMEDRRTGSLNQFFSPSGMATSF